MKTTSINTTRYHELIEIKRSDHHPHAYKPHLHSQLAIGIIEHGDTILSIDKEEIHFSKGDAVIIMPYVIHNCQPLDINNWAFSMIYLDDYYKEELQKYIHPQLNIGISKLGENEFKRIQTLIELLSSASDPFVEEVEIIDCLNTIIDAI